MCGPCEIFVTVYAASVGFFEILRSVFEDQLVATATRSVIDDMNQKL